MRKYAAREVYSVQCSTLQYCSVHSEYFVQCRALTLTLVAKMVRINLPGMKVFRTLKHFTIMYVRGYCKVILIENKWKFSEASFIAAVKVI